MRAFEAIRGGIVALASLGLLVPGPWPLRAAAGATPQIEQGPPGCLHAIPDVELDAAGALRGLVVSLDGVPQAYCRVAVRQGDREAGQAWTDLHGRFTIGNLRGGTYQVTAAGRAIPVRAWTANTAPPTAKPMVLLVVGQTVRGQWPCSQFFASDTIIVVGMVAAMIAIPIAVHNAGGGPTSP